MSAQKWNKALGIVAAAFVIMLALIALGTMSPAPAASANRVEIGQVAYMRFSDLAYPACKAVADIERFYELNRTDTTAAWKFSVEHVCTRIDSGAEVTVEDSSWKGYFCVRLHGDPDCVWVSESLVETKSAYDKDKANWDKQNADAASARKSFNDEFDRQHPECKDYKTNPHLPKDCY